MTRWIVLLILVQVFPFWQSLAVIAAAFVLNIVEDEICSWMRRRIAIWKAKPHG